MLSDTLMTGLHYLLPKKNLSQIAGLFANVKTPWIKNALIHQFIQRYQVNMAEALEENGDKYENFNAFFTRHLKPEHRPLAAADIISPVDGYLSEFGNIKAHQLVQAKGHHYSVDELLATDPQTCQAFKNGYFATFYLSPKDYHRIHMPLQARVRQMIYCPGRLFSVQSLTVKRIPRLFARNERLVVIFDTAHGPMAMVLVGAVIVGAIGVKWHGDISRSKTPRVFQYTESTEVPCLEQGDEMGYFKLGSTVILLFSKAHSLQWHSNLIPGDAVRFGQEIAQIAKLGP